MSHAVLRGMLCVSQRTSKAMPKQNYRRMRDIDDCEAIGEAGMANGLYPSVRV